MNALDDLPEFSGIKVYQVASRDGDDITTAWRATVEDDGGVPTFGGDTATEAVDVLLDHLRGDDHVSPFTDDDLVNIPCGCGDYEVYTPTGTVDIDVICPECGNHFGQAIPPVEDDEVKA